MSIDLNKLHSNIKTILRNKKKVIIYGYGFYGIVFERFLKDIGNFEIIKVDDMFKGKDIQTFDTLRVDKKSAAIICIYDRITNAKVMKKCTEKGFDSFDFIDILKKSTVSGMPLPSKSEISEFLKKIGYSKEKDDISTSCYMCGKEAREIYINMKDFHIAECLSCGHRFVTNMPKDSEVEEYYSENLAYYTDNYKKKLGDEGLKNSQNNWYIKTRMERLAKFIDLNQSKPLDILEIGCLDGILVYHLKNLGHRAVGVEINRPVAEYFSKFLEIDIRVGDLEKVGFEKESFDLIYSSHVLEHTTNPKEIITKANKLLKKGGMIISDLPCNENGFENYHHLHFFSEASIIKLHNDVFGNYEYYMDKPTKLDGFDYNTVCIMSVKIEDKMI